MSKCSVSIIIREMMRYYAGDIKRINHFLKVYSFAKTIGEIEQLDEDTQYILEIAAVMHDIGIKISEEKYNSSAGHYQELEGPPVAQKMLNKLDFSKEIIERVCFLIGHHHTYSGIDNIDYQILVEADFLVNIDEDNIDDDALVSVRDKIFKTKAGIEMLDNMYS